MRTIKSRQIKLLFLICPGPLGQGCTISEAATLLGITKRALQGRLKTIKRQFPQVKIELQSINDVVKRQRDSLKNGMWHGCFGLGWDLEREGLKIVDKF